MTTFADMTPEQCAECVGMWCEAVIHWKNRDSERMIGVISGLQFRNRNAHGPSVLSVPVLSQHSAHTITSFVPVENVTPRPDLPRAWNPDGSPVDGHWESEFERIIANGGKTEKTLTSRRFIGEWEDV